MFPEQKMLVYSTSNYLSDEISHILGKRGWWEPTMRTLSSLTQMKPNFEFSKIYDSPWEKNIYVKDLYSEMSSPTRLPLEILLLSLSPMPHSPIITDSFSQTGFCPRELMN